MEKRSDWWVLGVVVSLLACCPALGWAADHGPHRCEVEGPNAGLYLMTTVAVALPAAIAGILGSRAVRIVSWLVVVLLLGLGCVAYSMQRICISF